LAELFRDADQVLLEARAARLMAQSGRAVEDRLRTVAFTRAGARYAIDAAQLLSVRILVAPTPLPGAPPHLLGLIYLSGRLVPVVDLERLSSPAAPPPSPLWAVWVSRGPSTALLAADEVIGTEDLLTSQLMGEVAGTFAGALGKYLRAVLPGPLRLLDVSLLMQPELFRP
jgi:purine-binding chemotaxis protein CheW